MSTLELKQVTRRFADRVVLDRIALTLDSGSAAVLVGPSGVGKTTLLRLIAGLEQPDEGSIHLAGQLVNGLPPHQRKVSMVFQDLALWPHMTVLENVRFAAAAQDRKASQQRSLELLKLVGWHGREQAYPEQLSAGEKQRVALARALASEPEVLLLDEPLLNLDPGSRATLLGELGTIHRRLGFTMVYVTHYLEEALHVGDRLWFLLDGELELEGPLDEVIARPASPELAPFLRLSSQGAG